MTHPRNFAVMALAAALGLGMSAGSALAAPQTAHAGDHSSRSNRFKDGSAPRKE